MILPPTISWNQRNLGSLLKCGSKTVCIERACKNVSRIAPPEVIRGKFRSFFYLTPAGVLFLETWTGDICINYDQISSLHSFPKQSDVVVVELGRTLVVHRRPSSGILRRID